MLNRPFSELESWVSFFSAQNLPILRHTQRQLELARENIDTISGRDITRIVLRDPLLAVRVLAYIQPLTQRARLRHDVTTIVGAIMILGIETFFKRFDNLPVLEEQLQHESPKALLGALQVVQRSQQAAHYAYEWAVWRVDINVEEVTLAALLHDVVEILMYAYAPSLALVIRNRQAHEPTLRSVTVQKEVLGGLTIHEIKIALYRAWHFPELLLELLGESQTNKPRPLTVKLAVDLARHLSQRGWQDAALPDDFKAIAKLLNLSEEALGLRLGLGPPDTVPADPVMPTLKLNRSLS